MNRDGLENHLREHFDHILNVHMADLPIVNPALAVEVVGFRQWNAHYLCAVVTPWFMSLMLIPPRNQPNDPQFPVGSIQPFEFPSGTYEFTAAFDERLGTYLSCSLFSPMFEFDSHHGAVAVAQASLDAILKEEEPNGSNQSSDPIPPHGSINKSQNATQTDKSPSGILNPTKPMSRRDVFRAALRRGRS